MNNHDILWVGVSLDPNDYPRIPRSRFSEAHDNIVSALSHASAIASRTIARYPSGASCESYDNPDLGQVVDVFDALEFRIGFGIKVADSEQGKALIPKVVDWLRAIGVRLPVSVWVWSPSSVPSYTISKA